MGTPDFAAALADRDLLSAATDGFAARAGNGRPLAGYIGFDPTADSLHVGHLASVRMLAELAAAGGRPVAVVGGATGLVGDPAGKRGERPFLEEEVLDANKAAITAQLVRLLGPGVEVLDNRDWLGRWDMLGFLREIGRHFPLGEMLARDSVADRLAAGGMSFTEFTYSLLQAADFLILRRDRGIELQMGGSDQWGNITAGIDLVRRVLGRAPDGGPLAFGAVAPLLTDAAGRKMGKTEEGAVFLGPARTSPFAFFQFWLNVEDAQTGVFLRRLTDLSLADIADLEEATAARPAERAAQRALAHAVTAWVHGASAADLQERVAAAAFSREPIVDPAILAELHAQAAGFELTRETLEAGVAAVVHASGLAGSRSDARRLIAGGGVSVGGQRVSAPDEAVALVGGCWVVVRVGPRRVAVGRVEGAS